MKKSLVLTIILLPILSNEIKTIETAFEENNLSSDMDIRSELLLIKKEMNKLKNQFSMRLRLGNVIGVDGQGEIESLKGQALVSKKKDQLLKEIEARTEHLKERLEEEKTVITDLNNALQDKEEELTVSNLRNEELKGNLEQKKVLIKELEQKANKKNKNESIRLENNTFKQKAEEFERLYNETKKLLEKEELLNQRLNNDKNDILIKLETFEFQNSNLNEQNNLLITENKQLKESQDNKQDSTKIAELTKKLNEKEEEIEKMEKENEEMIIQVNEKFAEASKINEELEKDNKDKTDTIEVLYTEIDHLRMTVDELNNSPINPDTLRELKKDIEICENDNMILIDRVKELDNIIEEKEKDNQTLIQKVLEMNHYIDDMQNGVSNLQRYSDSNGYSRKDENKMRHLKQKIYKLKKQISSNENMDLRYNDKKPSRRRLLWNRSRNRARDSS